LASYILRGVYNFLGDGRGIDRVLRHAARAMIPFCFMIRSRGMDSHRRHDVPLAHQLDPLPEVLRLHPLEHGLARGCYTCDRDLSPSIAKARPFPSDSRPLNTSLGVLSPKAPKSVPPLGLQINPPPKPSVEMRLQDRDLLLDAL
jgi:hypothetical protein